MTVTIGSRGSQLALWQARHIEAKLHERNIATRIAIIKTTGDHLQTASLVQAGGKGLFTKEIEEALLAGAIDVAVHSLKDLPAEIPRGLTIAAVPEREDARDAMVGCRLDNLQHRARVGTSSGRRAAQLRLLRADLDVQPIRGNVDTRLRKLREKEFDAIVLAAAGLRRLGMQNEIAETFSPEQLCPAAGQGALAVQTRENDPAQEICAALNHEPSAQAATAERSALKALGGGCQLPIGVFAEVIGGDLTIMGVVISPDGRRALKARARGAASSSEGVGHELADDLLVQGAARILDESK